MQMYFVFGTDIPGPCNVRITSYFGFLSQNSMRNQSFGGTCLEGRELGPVTKSFFHCDRIKKYLQYLSFKLSLLVQISNFGL